MSLKNQVELILQKHPQARDSDQWLTIKIWTTFYPTKIDRTDEMNPKVSLRDIMKLPREDNVKRHRAIFQNDFHKYLPTSIEVVRARKQNEEMWREIVSKNTL